MITKLRIRNFQSLSQLNLELGQITVVKGPSNTGKSAVVRALQMLAMNTRSTAQFVAKGSKTAVVQAIIDDVKAVTISRGEGTAEYMLTIEGEESQTYKKCGANVPEDIKPHLRLAPVSFAAQFDKPYLTDESGTTVANTLGDLTDIDTLFAAMREANRRHLEAGRTMTTADAEIDRIRTSLATIGDVRPRRDALASAEEHINAWTSASHQAQVLRAAAEEFRNLATSVAAAELPPSPPDINEDLDKIAKDSDLAKRLRLAATEFQNASAQAVNCATIVMEEASILEAAIHRADTESHALLKAEGTCPLCLQTIQ